MNSDLQYLYDILKKITSRDELLRPAVVADILVKIIECLGNQQTQIDALRAAVPSAMVPSA